MRFTCRLHHGPWSCPKVMCDWLLNLFRNDFSLHQGYKCESNHGVRGPHKTCFKAYVIHWHGWSNGFLRWERQRDVVVEEEKQGPMVEKWCYIYFYNEMFFLGREDENKRSQENDRTGIYFIFYQISLFGHILNKFSTFTFGAWSFLLAHIWFYT